MTKVAIFYFYQGFLGGASSVTAHLYKGLQLAGFEPTIYRVRHKSETKPRPFAKYEGVKYWNTGPNEAIQIVKDMPSIMTAAAHSKHLQFRHDIISTLMHLGMKTMCYDPNEFKVYDHLNNLPRGYNPILIRPTMREYFPKAKVIMSPYVREFRHTPANWAPDDREWNAISVSRVTFVKRTEMIVDANRKLPKDKWCILRGAENRMFTKFKLGGDAGAWRKYYMGGTPLEWGAAARECARAKFAVDLTYFPNDGGGAHYATMEAWDAGAVNVVHDDWLRYPGEMKRNKNCLAVDSVSSLVNLLKDDAQYDEIAAAGFASLKPHNARRVAEEIVRELR